MEGKQLWLPDDPEAGKAEENRQKGQQKLGRNSPADARLHSHSLSLSLMRAPSLSHKINDSPAGRASERVNGTSYGTTFLANFYGLLARYFRFVQVFNSRFTPHTERKCLAHLGVVCGLRLAASRANFSVRGCRELPEKFLFFRGTAICRPIAIRHLSVSVGRRIALLENRSRIAVEIAHYSVADFRLLSGQKITERSMRFA